MSVRTANISGLPNMEHLEVYQRFAHDIRSPLSALQVLAETADGLNVEQRSLLQAISKRFTRLSQEVLDAAKAFKNARTKIKELKVGIQELVAEKAACQKNASIEVRFENSIPNSLACALDIEEALRTISNLIDNSLQAQSENPRVKVLLRVRNKRLIILVVDHGQGISPAILSQLGQKGATFGKTNGNGLGLWSARLAAERAGGKLRIASKIGRGTAVFLRLPIL